MRITKTVITKALEEAIIKCGPTLDRMHELLDGWSQKEKDTLLYYSGLISETGTGREYDDLLKNGTEEEIFQFEKQIFKKLNRTQQKNILKYLSDFDEKNYQYDVDVGYPNSERGPLEKRQENLQEQHNDYPPNVVKAFSLWTGGYYDEIQRYIRTGSYPSSAFYDGYQFKEAGDTIREFIQNNVGLDVNTLLFRGGHWDIGMKVGEVGTIPVLNSLSYSKESAYMIGIDSDTELEQVQQADGSMKWEEVPPPNRYMIDVYVDEGFKGAMVNAPSLSKRFPEHEFLIDKNTRYIVVDVDDVNKTAKIKLLPPE